MVIVYVALLSVGALIGHIRGDRDAKERIVELEMQNAAILSANRMLLFSVLISGTPIYVGIDRRGTRGNPIGGKRK